MPADTVQPQKGGQSLSSLFKSSDRVYPKRVTGRFRNLKWISMIVALAIYYLVPFIRWDRGPHMPNQAVLFDLEQGRVYWFGIELWPQEVYILTSILIFSAVALFFVTSLFGRVWCGYYCPQTVWTDLFVWVERIFQGDRNKRKKLREGPWTFEKFRKLGITHLVWLFIAWMTAGSFVLYFNDAPNLVVSFFTGDVSTTVLAFIVGLTVSTYIMAGFAREQVCFYMCPYARFQSAMFDKDTMIISYDEPRGEPRGSLKRRKAAAGTAHARVHSPTQAAAEARAARQAVTSEPAPLEMGDCIDCSLCVQVCPTGIDIRHGLQMECIACGLCADACDGVMDKLGKPRGLIGYETGNRSAEGQTDGGGMPSFRLLRGRTIYYSAVLLLVALIAGYALVNRSLLNITAIHDRNPLFVQLANGDIRNGYDIKILNKTHYPKTYTLSVAGLENAALTIQRGDTADRPEVTVPANSVGRFRVFVAAPKTAEDRSTITFVAQHEEAGLNDSYDSIFIRRTR